MAIRLVTGIPGSGKSYYCVSELVKNYCKEYGGAYVLKENIILITNINKLLLDSYNLDDMIAKAGSIEVFFTEAYQERVVEKFKGKNIVYVIDEAQKYFHRRYYNRQVFGFFETHRHLGLDVWLVAQNANLLARDILALTEYEIRAAPRTLSLYGFSYVRRSSGENVGRHVLRKNKKIFALYCSQCGEEAEKVKTPFVKYLVLFVVFVCVGIGVFRLTFASWGSEHDAMEQKNLVSGNDFVNKVADSGQGLNASRVESGIEGEKTVWKAVSYIYTNQRLALYDWSYGRFVPLELFSYPIVYDGSSARVVIYAKVPASEFVEEKSGSSI